MTRAAFALCAALTGCAVETIAPGTPKIVEQHPITPFDTHEECAVLAAGERLDFGFTSTSPVDFDVRYRERGATLMPIAREKTTAYSTIFVASFPQRYCLAWEAGRSGALVDYRIQIRPPLPPR